MTQPDLGPAAERMADLITKLDPASLDVPTPCPDYTLGDLVDHVRIFTENFTQIAQKTANATQPPLGSVANLPPDWQSRLPRDLASLAEAWRDPDAWTGMAKFGGIESPAEVAGAVALEELVVHGWDIAQSSGQSFDADRASLEVAHGMLSQFNSPEAPAGGPFGPAVPTDSDAPLLDQVIALSGRDPQA